MFNSRLFKRANECECGEGSCKCGSVKVMGRLEVKAALESATKLSSYLEQAGGSFRDVRSIHEASRKLAHFLRTNTDLVPNSVVTAAKSIQEFHARLASNEFDYDSLVDESGPNEMFDAPEDLLSDAPKADAEVVKELGNDEVPVLPSPEDKTASVTKVADSELLNEGAVATPSANAGKWDGFSNEALTGMIQTLTDTDGFSTDSESQKSVAEMAEVLAKRPTPAELEEESKDTSKAASFKGLRLASPEEAPVEDQHIQDDPSGSKLPTQPGIRKESEPVTAAAKVGEGEYGVRWSEFGKDDRIVKKEKNFKTEAARTKYTKDLEKKDNFKCFDSWADPTPKVKEGKIASDEHDVHIPEGECPQCGHKGHGSCPECGSKTASDTDDLKIIETAETKINKLIKTLEDFDIASILEAKGQTPSVQNLQSAMDTLKEKANMALKDVEIQISAIETTEEERKDSMDKKSSRLRGLRLAEIE